MLTLLHLLLQWHFAGRTILAEVFTEVFTEIDLLLGLDLHPIGIIIGCLRDAVSPWRPIADVVAAAVVTVTGNPTVSQSHRTKTCATHLTIVRPHIVTVIHLVVSICPALVGIVSAPVVIGFGVAITPAIGGVEIAPVAIRAKHVVRAKHVARISETRLKF